MTAPAVPVLIVGGGPAGLTAAVLLADLGVPAVLIERNASTTDHPRAHVVNTRTMEIFRRIGIADAVAAAGLRPEAYARVLWKRTVTGEELGALEADEARLAVRARVSPARMASCPQDHVERLLRQAAEGRGCDLRFGTELVGYEQDAERVSVTVRDGAGERRLDARYVIAADGAASPSRGLLGVAMTGLPAVATLVGIYFHAELEPWLRERPALLYFLLNSAAPGVVIALDGRRRWVYHHLHFATELPTLAEAAALARAAIGRDDVAVDVRSVRPWVMTAEVAERFRVGRVFLAGDAAHRFPPTGGFGLNTGVQDVHNLVWKLALVLAGPASDGLLDSYERERRPVAQANTDWSVRNFLEGGSAVGPGAVMATMQLESGVDVPAVLAKLQADIDGERDHFDALGQDLGFVYERGALVPDGTRLPPVDDPAAEYVPNARPGSRAPHFWLPRASTRVSSLDLFGGEFVLLTGNRGAAWATAVVGTRVPIRIHRLGCDGDLRVLGDDTWRALYGIEPDGAVLVRPDGHVAWRARHAASDPAATLHAVLARVLDGGDR